MFLLKSSLGFGTRYFFCTIWCQHDVGAGAIPPLLGANALCPQPAKRKSTAQKDRTKFFL